MRTNDPKKLQELLQAKRLTEIKGQMGFKTWCAAGKPEGYDVWYGDTWVPATVLKELLVIHEGREQK